MATIMQVKATGYWTLKTTVDNKDKRIKLRRFTANEPKQPVPKDVLDKAVETGFYSLNPETKAKPAKAHVAVSDLEAYIAYFLEVYKAEHRPATVSNMTRILGMFVSYAKQNGVQALNEVNEAVINRYFYWRLKLVNTSTKKTIQPHVGVSELELLSGLFSFAMDENILTNNPVKKPVKRLRKHYPAPDPDKTTKHLEPEETAKFLDNLEPAVVAGVINRDYADAAIIMLATGMRVSAVLAMRTDWLVGDCVLVPIPNDKAKKGYTAFVNPLAKLVLQRRVQNAGADGRLFMPTCNRHASFQQIRRYCRVYKIDAPGAFNHMLRHTVGTASVDCEIPVQIIMEQLGQGNIKTTMRYAKVRNETLMKQMSKVNFDKPDKKNN